MTTDRLILVGYRGTGKTTVGRLLADRLGWSFADCDEAIEAAAGKSVADIFASEGVGGLGVGVADALRELCSRERCVIATGGGAVLRPANRERLRASGFVAWLTASPETIRARLEGDPTTAARRPNLTAAGGIQEVRTLLATREPLYREVADFVADADAPSPEAVADAILKAWSGWQTFRSSSGAGASSSSGLSSGRSSTS